MPLLAIEGNDIPGLRNLTSEVQTLGARECVVHSIEFETADFETDAFASAGIELPVEVARSVPKRQAEYFFGRLAATMALRSAGVARARIARGLLRQPVFPRGYVGSITHTCRLAAAAVLPAAGCEGLGIDIEELLSEASLRDVERIALCPDELDVLRACNTLPHAELVTLVFSAKESFYKAVAACVGRIFEYDALRLKGLDPGQAKMLFVTTGNLSSAWIAGREVEIHFSRRADRAVLTAFAW
jgi:4'-phosphopantetheinyl transferase EntD